MKPLVAIFCLLLCGCQLPQWRLFQAKVPQPIVKPASTVEVERQAADLLAKRIEKPVELIPVAKQLSASLGVPKEPIEAPTDEAAEISVKALEKALLAQQKQIADLNKILEKNEGKKVEGTGINVFGFTFSLGVIGIIVLCVMFPGVALIIWSIIRRISGALTSTAKGIKNYIDDHPDAGEQLKDYLSRAQDAAHKATIGRIRDKL